MVASTAVPAQAARTHAKTHSQRRKHAVHAHGKDARLVAGDAALAAGKKRVFRPILTSPFTVDWCVHSAYMCLRKGRICLRLTERC